LDIPAAAAYNSFIGVIRPVHRLQPVMITITQIKEEKRRVPGLAEGPEPP